MARKVFGQDDPVGKSLKMSDSTTVVITGVMDDIKNSVLPPMDMLLRVERATEFNPSISKQASGNAGASVTFLKMPPRQDMNTHREEVLAFFKERYWLYARGLATDVRYVPLREVYFEESDSAVLQQGDHTFVNLLLWAGLLVLFFSVFNYINLTVAQSGFRAKEVATRRLLGDSRCSVGFHLILEAVLLTLLSYGLAVLLAAALRPLASNLLQAEIDLAVLCSPEAILLSVLLIAVVGLLLCRHRLCAGCAGGVEVAGAMAFVLFVPDFHEYGVFASGWIVLFICFVFGPLFSKSACRPDEPLLDSESRVDLGTVSVVYGVLY